MPFVAERPNGSQQLIPICQRCGTEAFSLEGWTKLWSPNNCSAYAENKIFLPGHQKPYSQVGRLFDRDARVRGPILRLARAPADLLNESDGCCLCNIVTGLDIDGRLQNGQHEEVAVDLQILIPEISSGIFDPFLLSVTLHCDLYSRQGKPWGRRKCLVLLDTEGSICPTRCDRRGLIVVCRLAQQPFANDRPETSNLADMENILLEARQWHDHCDRNHPECGQRQSCIPTRVLEVRGGNLQTIRLVDFGDKRPLGCFAALSYVWGTTPAVRLLDHNRDALQAGIEYNALPRTIQDAIRVTLALNLSYLWVDALCILQDNSRDKDQQISNMNEYYRDATIVISASGAPDVNTGFLTRQMSNSDIIGRPQFIFGYNGIGESSACIPFIKPNGEVVLRDLFDYPPLYSFSKEPINKRGWTLQESALARRLLIFPASGGVIARCARGIQPFGQVIGNPWDERPDGTLSALEIIARFREISPAQNRAQDEQPVDDKVLDIEELKIDETDTSNSNAEQDLGTEMESSTDKRATTSDDDEIALDLFITSIMKKHWRGRRLVAEPEATEKFFERADWERDSTELTTVFNNWAKVVEDYTHRRLSDPRDILVALSALAKEYAARHEQLLGPYVAGLWTATIREGLLWHTVATEANKGSETTLTDNIVLDNMPSWSWASRIGPVKFVTGTEASFIPKDDERRKATAESSEWYVEVSNCQTTLKNDSNPFGAVTNGYLDLIGVLLPIRRSEIQEKEFDIALVAENNDLVRHSDLICDNTESLHLDMPDALAIIDASCHWLPVFYARRRRSRGLIVREKTDGSYERLGFAEFFVVPKACLRNTTKRAIRLV